MDATTDQEHPRLEPDPGHSPPQPLIAGLSPAPWGRCSRRRPPRPGAAGQDGLSDGTGEKRSLAGHNYLSTFFFYFIFFASLSVETPATAPCLKVTAWGGGGFQVLQPKNSRQKPRNVASFLLNRSPSSNLFNLFNFFFFLSLMQ